MTYPNIPEPPVHADADRDETIDPGVRRGEGAPLDFGPPPQDRTFRADTEDDAADPADDAPEPTLTGGYVPPLFAMADDEAAPATYEPPPQRPLTVRIHQGMPSYSEPDPHIAGVVGRAARGEDTSPEPDPQG